MKKLLNTSEASKITGYSIAHIRELAKAGKLKMIRIGPHSQMRFKEPDLMNLTHAPKIYKKAK